MSRCFAPLSRSSPNISLGLGGELPKSSGVLPVLSPGATEGPPLNAYPVFTSFAGSVSGSFSSSTSASCVSSSSVSPREAGRFGLFTPCALAVPSSVPLNPSFPKTSNIVSIVALLSAGISSSFCVSPPTGL